MAVLLLLNATFHAFPSANDPTNPAEWIDGQKNITMVGDDYRSSSSSSILLNHNLPTTVVVGCSLTAVIVVTVLGNLLVGVALFRYRSLRTTSNYLIGNLALSDFLLATTILPLSTVNECLGHWVFGRVTCGVWLITDVLYCTASIWNLCVIAFDRFTATLYPMWYRDRRSARQAGVYVLVVWVIASAVSVPPLLGWNDLAQNYVGEITDRSNGAVYFFCTPFQTPSYVLYSAAGSFFVPFSITFGLYVKIFGVLRRRATERGRSAVGARGRRNALRPTTTTTEQERTPLWREGGRPTNTKEPWNKSSSSFERTATRSRHPSRQLGRLQGSTNPDGHCSEEALPLAAAALALFSRRVARRCSGTNHPIPTVIRRVSSPRIEGGRTQTGSGIEKAAVPVGMERPNTDAGSVGTSSDGGEREGGEIIDPPPPTSFPYPRHPLPSPPLRMTSRPMRISRSASIVASFRSLGSLRSVRREAWRRRHHRHHQQQNTEQVETRATVRMAVIIAAFCGMWLGFFVIYVLNVWCAACRAPREMEAFFFWLGYLNSTVNPVLYTIFNEDFRRAFRKILRLDRPKPNAKRASLAQL